MKNLKYLILMGLTLTFALDGQAPNEMDSKNADSTLTQEITKKESPICGDLKLEEKSSNLTLQVLNTYETQKEILKYLEAQKGFLKERQEKFLVVSIPTCELSKILEHLSAKYNLLDKGIKTQSLTWDHKQKSENLRSKESLLQNYFDLLKESDSGSFLEVEREIQQLTNEIENLKSNIEEIEFRASYSEMQILFNEVDQKQRISNFKSSFAWINDLNLVDLMRDFE